MIKRLKEATKLDWKIHQDTNDPWATGDNYSYWVEYFNDGYKLQWANMFAAFAPEKTLTFEQLTKKINTLEGRITCCTATV